jgi:hypothetical protein
VEALIRGHMVHTTGRYIVEDPVLSKKVKPELIEKIRRDQTAFAGKDWRPRTELTSLWQAIADVVEPREHRAVYDALARCGETVGTYATNTFFKLLLKILTPRMFASRFSEFYKRDQVGGEGIVEEVGSNRVVLLARGIKGYDHFGPVTSGWASVPFRGMGLKNVRVTCSPWSLEDPGPDEVRFVIEWDA